MRKEQVFLLILHDSEDPSRDRPVQISIPTA